MSIAENIAGVQERIASAALRVGRDPQEITLMAVSKTVSANRVLQAYDAGIRVFGENRVQEFAGKVAAVRALQGAQWHMIGHLQSNKAGKAAELFNAIDSVDTLKLAEKLNAGAKKLEKKLAVLIEINVGGEEAKSGVVPESHELEEILQAAPQFDHLAVCGLMTIPPFADDPQRARGYFQKLRGLRDKIAAQQFPNVNMDVLSMGMSHDFEVAVEEGSTCVRVGTTIFGKRISGQQGHAGKERPIS